ncbi:MAG: hypothetical protein AAB731_03465 [Patescibacteria group bacterium]
MPKLTGREAQLLAYLAQYLNAPDAEAVIGGLSNVAAEIARYGEASALAYLAEYPNAPDAEAVIGRLSNVAAEIARVLTGKTTGNESEEAKAGAEALKEWVCKMH